MDINKILKAQYLEVVDDHLTTGEPPETRTTLERLVENGASREKARLLIAQCVAVEINRVMKENTPFNTALFVQNLNRLPEPPQL